MLFQYTYLTRSAIRLVRFHPLSTPSDIHLTLEHQENFSSSEAQYTVLSCPHSDGESKSLTLHGRTRMVPAPVWDALSAIQKHGDTQDQDRYWVNAVCVNPRDEDEKQYHVSQMEQIYASAQKVLAWSGQEDGHIENAGRKADPKRMDDIKLDEKDRDAVRQLLQRKFSQQDLALVRHAKHVELMCGKYRCDMGLVDHNLQANTPSNNSRRSSQAAL
ncbi:uncharacterized protein MYCFIDRAFT_79731 [Pseudocercospora fijiensis CIRAD86]|uniref:Heterokaryon incompatibility domain-containing protein n=1 Tax=Pseudocercospora fijiensis (strain CIRAD86) TaxID=383855 RepID=M3A3C9_PSEFD|nr:uncharacterized protein MYCFIDRAFT_79731 [Pseudocercospora fijiensis CIRAD86]EME79146.1 hypothetical protein MYCFIDRAFT_79731 [Pseudocercospora fijiensis CIRAD86]